MVSLNFSYIIAHLYFGLINLWPTPQEWLVIKSYVGFVWTLLFFGLIFLLTVMVYRVNRLQAKHRQDLFHGLVTALEKKMANKAPEEWQEILDSLNSENVNDWKLAIIKADTILDGLTVRMNVIGDNLGERLKNLTSGDLRNLDEAWEAHKIRNQIAHDNDFVLSKYEARRVIALFERVFRELDYI